MKSTLLLFSTLLAMNTPNSSAQSTEPQTQIISTSLGDIHVYLRPVAQTIPIIFLHGVYFDHHLWDNQVAQITDRTTISIDMPLHGQSKNGVPDRWSVTDMGNMLLEILEELQIPEVYAIGQSWGSSTILAAAHRAPQRFRAIGLGNMPTEAGTKGLARTFWWRHRLLPFRQFYSRQVVKAMMGKDTFKQQPELLSQLRRSMNLLSNAELRQIDHLVIVEAEATASLLEDLKMPALALKGKEDYVPDPPGLPLRMVEGGHVSPFEAPEEVMEWINEVIGAGE